MKRPKIRRFLKDNIFELIKTYLSNPILLRIPSQFKDKMGKLNSENKSLPLIKYIHKLFNWINENVFNI